MSAEPEAPHSASEGSSERSAIATVLAHPLLRELEPRVRAGVRAAFRVRRFEDGALVFGAGDPADSVVVVGAGAVDCFGGPRAKRGARRVRAGEILGEEALAPGARRVRSVAVGSCVLAEIPVAVLRRAAERSFGTELHRRERRARRAAFRSLLAGTPLGAEVPEAAFEALFASAVEAAHARGARLVLSGEHACLIVDGLFRLSPGAGFRGRGDTLGLAGALAGEPLEAVAEAIADALVLQFPKQALRALERAAPRALALALAKERAAQERQERVLSVEPERATRVAANELGRLASASSLLSIELDRCTRCGACAKACADTHDDARLLRQGDKVLATLATHEGARKTALLFPVACQHCREPACLSACPTGAIVRDGAAAVLIREDLCTGCGACATACPWDAVRMRERGPEAEPVAGAGSALVASKCDLCHGKETAACVDVCPTAAIARLRPERDVLELAALSIGGTPRRSRGEPRAREPRSPFAWVARAAVVPPAVAALLLGLEHAGPRLRLVAGVLAASIVLLLAAHSWVKASARARSFLARFARSERRAPIVRRALALHGLLGVLAVPCVLLHAGLRVPSGVAGVLCFSFWASALSGALGALAYRLLPSRVTRLERAVVLPEDGPRELERLLDALFAGATGQNPAIKQLLASVLVPYVHSRLGVLELLCSGRSLSGETARLARGIERRLSGRASERLAPAKPLVETAVLLRAERAKRVLEKVLAAFVPVHFVLSGVTLVVLALHVVGVLW